MFWDDFAGGFLLGLLVACPIGPVSLTCIRNGIIGNPMTSTLTGLGAAFAHGMFALGSSLAAVAIADFMTRWQPMLTLFSAIVLFWLGLSRLSRTLPRQVSAAVEPARPGLRCLQGLLLAASNPLTVLPYIAFAASAAHAGTSGPEPQTLVFALGAAVGAGTWYGSVTTLSTLAGRKVGRNFAVRLDMASGILFVGFGCILLARGI